MSELSFAAQWLSRAAAEADSLRRRTEALEASAPCRAPCQLRKHQIVRSALASVTSLCSVSRSSNQTGSEPLLSLTQKSSKSGGDSKGLQAEVDSLRVRLADAEQLAADRGRAAERLQRTLDEGGGEDGQGGAAAARGAAAAAAATAAEALRKIGTLEEVRSCCESVWFLLLFFSLTDSFLREVHPLSNALASSLLGESRRRLQRPPRPQAQRPRSCGRRFLRRKRSARLRQRSATRRGQRRRTRARGSQCCARRCGR